MLTLWFVVVACMLTVYVILDGFDLGAGAVHFLVGKTPAERETLLRAIGPVWDGNEVWLLAAGGTLYFSFPLVYASSFSGFYLPLMMVLWLLMLRGMGIELRHQMHHPLWCSFWDFIFSVASIALAIVLGAALGNVLRGVPLNSEGYFFVPLWTNFRVSSNCGVLDWYTVLAGVTALMALATHGANYLALKTEAEMRHRSHRLALGGAVALCLLTVLTLAATVWVRPELLGNYQIHLWGWGFPVLVAGSLAGMILFRKQGRDLAAFLSSAGYLAGLLGGAAFGLYPKLLLASTDPAWSLTIYTAAAPTYGLQVGVVWVTVGTILVIGYFTYLYRSFAGRVTVLAEEEH